MEYNILISRLWLDAMTTSPIPLQFSFSSSMKARLTSCSRIPLFSLSTIRFNPKTIPWSPLCSILAFFEASSQPVPEVHLSRSDSSSSSPHFGHQNGIFGSFPGSRSKANGLFTYPLKKSPLIQLLYHQHQ